MIDVLGKQTSVGNYELSHQFLCDDNRFSVQILTRDKLQWSHLLWALECWCQGWRFSMLLCSEGPREVCQHPPIPRPSIWVDNRGIERRTLPKGCPRRWSKDLATSGQPSIGPFGAHWLPSLRHSMPSLLHTQNSKNRGSISLELQISRTSQKEEEVRNQTFNSLALLLKT